MASRFIVSPAGSGKTGKIIDEALLAVALNLKVLITTYTNENTAQIVRRITERVGCVPKNIDVMTWFQFLLRDGVKPYQSFVTEMGSTRSVNYVTENPPFANRADIGRYYFDSAGNVYSDSLSDLVCVINERSGGLVVDRLEAIYDEIYIDELQDLVGYDLEFISLLLNSKLSVIAVGDPRQHTFGTNRSNKNKQYRGTELMKWINLRLNSECTLETVEVSKRCNQAICDFASALYPDFPAMTTSNLDLSGHDGIFLVREEDVQLYVNTHSPQAIRYRVDTPTRGLPALNIGVAKGSTFEHVLIFPTRKMVKYLQTSKVSDAGDIAKFYVAVTRAKYSVGFVIAGVGPLNSPIAMQWQA